MFNLRTLLMNFGLMRRLHLSFLLPAVLTYIVILSANVNSVYAETLENQPTANPVLLPATNPINDVITWLGDIEFKYEPQKIIATAEKAEYFQSEKKVVLTGNVKILQAGKTQELETATFFIEGEFKMAAEKVVMPNIK